MASFETLYHETLNLVYGYLKSRLINDSAINDILQETFIAVWKNSRQYNNKSKAVTWIIGIARYKMIDFLRGKYKNLEDGMEVEIESCTAEEDFTERLSEKVDVERALQLLDGSSKELIYLVYNAGLSYREAAIILGIPEGTVKSRMHSIKNELRKMLDKGGEGIGR